MLTHQNLDVDQHLEILTPRDRSKDDKDISKSESSKVGKNNKLDVMDLLKQDFDQPVATTPKSMNSPE